MPRLLLLIPTSSYRTQAFLDAARRLGVAITVASEEAAILADAVPDSTITLDFRQPDEAARRVATFSEAFPVDAVLGVDDPTTVPGAAIARALGIPHNTVASVAATRNKFEMRERLSHAGLPGPTYRLLSIDDDPLAVAAEVSYPVVLKPTVLSASRGVIRADDPGQFAAAFRRIAALLRTPEIAELGEEARQVLVEGFVGGAEVAVEGLLVAGELQVLAIFDKPDTPDGPFFEETVLVTPSRLSEPVQRALTACTARAVAALGLEQGPVHAELRLGDDGPVLLEVAARSIGGLCSRTLRFGEGMSLEEVILRQALGMAIPSLERETAAAGVMMVPVHRSGVFTGVKGLDAALAVAGIEDVVITVHPGQAVEPLPEGSRYLGFIFARGTDPARVEAALREAHGRLQPEIDRPPGQVPAPASPHGVGGV